MGTRLLKPRHVVTAMHLQEILEEIFTILNDFEATEVKEYLNHCLCLSHYGKIEIQKISELDAVYAWDLKNFYIFTHKRNSNHCSDKIINYKEVIDFTKQMICESMHDWEYCKKFSYREDYPIKDRIIYWLNDPEHEMQVINAYQWIEPYRKIANNKLFYLLNEIQKETGIYGIHFSFLKDYLLEKIYNLKGYMPKRYDPYRYNYQDVYTEQITDNRIDELIEKGLELKKWLTPLIRREMPEVNLFTDIEVEDIVKHIISVFVSYHYYELGKHIITNNDTN